MNRKGQTEDVFADLIPSIILIVIGGFVLYYFSAEFSGEIGENERMIHQLDDRESFSIEGMMEHQTELEGKNYKLIELVGEYNKEGKYGTTISDGVDEYIDRIEPKITSCFKIKLATPKQKELKLVDTCELTYLWTESTEKEEAILPLYRNEYAKIIIEHEEPKL